MHLPFQRTVSELFEAAKEYSVKIKLTFAHNTLPNTTVVLEDDDFTADGGLTIRQVYNSNIDISIGCSSSSEITAYIINSDKLQDIDWSKEFTLSFGFNLVTNDERAYEYFDILICHCDRPKGIDNNSVVQLIAKDRVAYFNESADDMLESLTYPVYLYQIVSAIQSHFSSWNITIGQGDILYIDANKDVYWAAYETNPFPKGTTYRDILTYLAEINGCNLICNMYDKNIVIKKFSDQSSDYALTRDDYFAINMDDDTTSAVDTVQYISEDGNTVASYPSVLGNEVLKILGNPLMNLMPGITPFTQDDVVQKICERIASVGAYHPMSIRAIGLPFVEVGDIISVEYASEQYVNMPIFARTLFWNGSLIDTYECTGQKHRTNEQNDNWSPPIHDGQFDYAKKTELDAVNDKLMHKFLGTFTTEAQLITALNTMLSSMANYECRCVRFDFSNATTNFRANHYYGTLSRAGSDTHGVLMLTNVSTIIKPVNGAKTADGWVFKPLVS